MSELNTSGPDTQTTILGSLLGPGESRQIPVKEPPIDSAAGPLQPLEEERLDARKNDEEPPPPPRTGEDTSKLNEEEPPPPPRTSGNREAEGSDAFGPLQIPEEDR